MTQNKKCPQCGLEFYRKYNPTIVCPMCGWNQINGPYDPTPHGAKAKIDSKSAKWKLSASVAVLIVVFVFGGIAVQINDQRLANQALSRAKGQMDQRMYASAAKTLNRAPISPITKTANKELLKDNIKWARDNTRVEDSKDLIEDTKSDEALNKLDDVNTDFPQSDEVVDLIDVAQEQTFNPDDDVSEQELDEIAFVPDDPEQDNLDAIEQEAQNEQDVVIEDGTATSEETPAQNAQPSQTTASTTQGQEAAPAQTTNQAAVAGDQPDSPSGQTVALVPLYQLVFNKQGDQDSFFTIDLAGEANPKKDKKTNFAGYGPQVTIGNIYNRSVAGKSNIVPIYRYWSAQRTDHYYTTNSNFSSSSDKANYVKQQVAGYIGVWDGAKCLEGTTPLINVYNPKLSDNFYTTNAAIKDALVKSQGWVNPKVVGCIW